MISAGRSQPKDEGSPDGRPNTTTTGASAAGVRALTARLAAFYFRVPVKAFFRTRVDYLAYPRAINPLFVNRPGKARWSWQTTSFGILTYAVKQQGWRFIPQQVLPPLLANVTIGAVLYTSYLQALGIIYPPAAQNAKRIYPPPSFGATFQAGFAAGTIQSLLAAPLDALTIRFETSDLADKRYKTMWHYAYQKARAIGTRGVFSGWSISMAKDSLGFGFFFASFEYVKSQLFYDFVTSWYGGSHQSLSLRQQKQIATQQQTSEAAGEAPAIKPHYIIEPAFLLLAGASATVMQQLVQHPLSRIQDVHFRRIPGLDSQMANKPPRSETVQMYAQAYRKTWKQCLVLSGRAGGWRPWLFAQFWSTTLRQVPSTSAALIAFEVLRRKYGLSTDAVRIHKDDYDLLLS